MLLHKTKQLLFPPKKYFLLSFFAAIFILFSNQIYAAGDCSPFIGQASLNEFFKDQANQSNDPDDFAEVKILNDAIGSAVYETWKINICEKDGPGQNDTDGCSGEILISNFSDTTKPWLVLKGPASGTYINLKSGFDATLVDGNGDLIDYLSVSSFEQALTEPDPDITCALSNLVFDYQASSPGVSDKTIFREPDGTGDWDSAASASAPPTEDTTNDNLPPPPPSESYPFVTINDISLDTGSSGTFFTVSLVDSDGIPTTFSQTITISYFTQDGTATVLDNDYTAIPLSTLTISSGQSSATISIDASSSDSNDVGEYFYAVLNAVENSAANGNNPNAYILKHYGTATLGGPLAEWNFDVCNISNPDDITDSSGNGHHATPNNGVTTTTGRICTAGSFDGNDDYVSIPSLPNLTDSFTISAWINPNDINNDQRIFADDETNSGGFAFSLGDGGDGRLRFFSRDVTPLILDSSQVISAGNWYHVVAVHDSNNKTRQIFVNGSDVTGGAQPYTGTWGSDSGVASIGGETDGAGSEGNSNWRFNGLIDEFKIYTRALSAAEISSYYSNPDPLGRTCDTCVPTVSQTIVLSTESGESLPGIGNFNDEDVVEYDPATATASIYSTLNNALPASADINALHIHIDGRIIFSTIDDVTIGADTFQDDDLIAYDPSNNTFSLYFNGADHFSNNNEDIDAIHIIDDDNLYLSTTGGATLGSGASSLSFENGDLIKYNMTTKIPTYIFGESNSPDIFSGGANIDGIHYIDDGNFLLSTDSTETLTTSPSGTFEDGDIFLFHPDLNTVDQIPYFDEDNFSNGADIDALTLPPLNTIHHIEFVHDGAAITCNAESILVKACADSDCSLLSSSAVTVGLLPKGWEDGDTQTFTGSATYNLKHTVAEIIKLDTSSVGPSASSAVVCKDLAGTVTNCEITFYSSGLVFDVPTQTSCATSANVTVQALGTDPATSQCVPLFNNVSKTLKAWTAYVDPAVGDVVGTPAVALTNNITPTAGTVTLPTDSAPATDNITLNFDATATATFTVEYPDAGQLALNMRFDGTGTEAGLVLLGNDSFVTAPNHLKVNSPGTNFSCISGDPTDPLCKPYVAAGDNFVMSIGAFCTDNITITPNFRVDGITLTSNLITPNTASGGVNAILGVTTFNMVKADNGNHVFNNQTVDEVGVFRFTATPPATYLGVPLTTAAGTSPNLGYFYPHHFTTSVTNACTTGAADFTYSGQPFNVTMTAFNGLTPAGITTNYFGGFVKNPTVTDKGATYTLANNIFDGTAHFTNTAAGIGVNNNVTLTFADKRTTPQVVTIQADDDNDTVPPPATATNDDITSDGNIEGVVLIRSGRMRLENAFGSELVDMPITAQVEYFDLATNDYAINTSDTCTQIDVRLTDLDATDLLVLGDGNPANSGETCVVDDLNFSVNNPGDDFSCTAGDATHQFSNAPTNGSFNLYLQSPGANNTGDIGIELFTTPTWLQLDLDGDGNPDGDPTATASFGLYRGDDRIIYWREVFQ